MRDRPQRTTPSIITMPMPGRSPSAMDSSIVLPEVCWALSRNTKSAGLPFCDQPGIELAHARRVAGRHAEDRLRRHAAEAGEERNRAQDAERLHARARGRIGAEDHLVRALEFDGGFERGDGRLFVAVVHDLDGALGLLAQLADVAGGSAVWPPLM